MNDRIKPTDKYGFGLHTTRQAQLQAAANRLLRKAKYFPKHEKREEAVVEAEACGQHGLRPTWHGRAS